MIELHDYLLPWLTLMGVQVIEIASPGPAFAMTVRNATVHGRRAGIMTAIGLGQGVGLHVFLVLTGISIILMKMPLLFYFIKYAGAAYLIYIGVKGLMAKPRAHGRRRSFIAIALNPKAWIYFSAVFSQFITPETPVQVLVLYGASDVFIETFWFAGLSVFLTYPLIQQRFLAFSHWIDRVCGAALAGLGIKMALSKL